MAATKHKIEKPTSYDEHQKITILKTLELHGFNYARTSKETKVSRTTLLRWVDKYGEKVFKKDRIESLAVIADKAIESAATEYAEKITKAKELVIDRIIERIPLENNLLTLNETLERLHRLDIGETPADSAHGIIQQNFIQMISEQFNNKSNE